MPRGRIIVVSLLAAAAALVLIVWADSTVAFYLGMIGMGAATGLGGPAVAAHAVDVVPEEAIGPAMGMLRFAGDCGYLIGPLSLGLLVDMALVGHGGAILINAALLAGCSLIFALFAGAPCARASPPRYDLTEERTMTERIWDKFLTERDKAVFAASGYGRAGRLG